MSWQHLNARVWRRATALQPGERSSWPGVSRKEASSTPRGVTHNKLGRGHRLRLREALAMLATTSS